MKCKHCGNKIKNKSKKGSFNANQNGTKNTANNGFFGIGTGNTKKDFAIGTLIGVAAAFILTNESAQRAILKGFAKLSTMLEMGAEELKERYEDAKAELDI